MLLIPTDILQSYVVAIDATGAIIMRVGDKAPDFTLPGYFNDEFEDFSLSETLQNKNAVLLTFYPGDFTPVCTEQLCEYRDADWYTYKKNLQVFGISRDNVYAHKQFAEENNLNHPLLSDVDGAVCGSYDALVDEFEGMKGVPRRSVFLIGSDRTIEYIWQTEDNWEKPTINHIREAVRKV